MSGLTSPTHVALLLVVLLLVFGAKRLPELGRSLGHGMREFKDSIGGASPLEHPNPGAHLAEAPVPVDTRVAETSVLAADKTPAAKAGAAAASSQPSNDRL